MGLFVTGSQVLFYRIMVPSMINKESLKARIQKPVEFERVTQARFLEWQRRERMTAAVQ